VATGVFVSALSDVKVLDFTRMHSGPFASMILGDLGADVLKIEPPIGDETRRMTRFSYGPMSAFYAASNRNKRSLVLDLHDPESRPALDRLVAEADIVIDNFRPSTLRRVRLDYEQIVAVNPDVISVSITGYGVGSPEENSPAYDLLAQARSGIMSLTGDPDGAPLKAGAPIGDLVAGIYGVVGALAALHERERSGKGQRIEVAMLDAQIAMVHYHYSYFDASGVVLPRVGSAHQNMVPYGIFRCSDGYLAIAAVPEPPKFWLELCEALGHPEWIDDDRFATAEARHLNRDALKDAMEEVLGRDTKAEWFRILTARGIPVAPVNDLSDLPNDEQVLARGMLVEVESPDYGAITLPGNPIKMPGALAEAEWTAPPMLGENEPAAWRGTGTGADGAVAAAEPFDTNLIGRRKRSTDGADEWALLAWSCHACGRVALGTADKCPTCGSPDGEPTTLRDSGVLETWSRIAAKGGAYIVGYALVGSESDPDAAVRVFARIEAESEESLALGMPVTVEFVTADEAPGPSRVQHSFRPIHER
jgi:CoA:oxalate CoA-transferase